MWWGFGNQSTLFTSLTGKHIVSVTELQQREHPGTNNDKCLPIKSNAYFILQFYTPGIFTYVLPIEMC